MYLASLVCCFGYDDAIRVDVVPPNKAGMKRTLLYLSNESIYI